jgi:hypothetical protein
MRNRCWSRHHHEHVSAEPAPRTEHRPEPAAAPAEDRPRAVLHDDEVEEVAAYVYHVLKDAGVPQVEVDRPALVRDLRDHQHFAAELAERVAAGGVRAYLETLAVDRVDLYLGACATYFADPDADPPPELAHAVWLGFLRRRDLRS